MVELVEGSGCFRRPASDPRPWLPTNPLPVPTERERHVLSQGLPVYRVLFHRNAAPPPPLAALEAIAVGEAAEATHNPGH